MKLVKAVIKIFSFLKISSCW